MKAMLTTFAAVLLLSACGSDNPTQKFTAASGNITQATAAANIGTVYSNATLDFTSPNGNPGLRSDPFSPCTTASPASPTDGDGDGIETSLTKTYACTNIDLGSGLTGHRAGTSTTVDTDDTDNKSGWKRTYDIAGGYTDGTNGEDYIYNGFWEVVKSATAITYRSDYKSTGSNTHSGVTTTYIGGGTWGHTITPNDMTNPYALGGAITFDGYMAHSFTVNGTPENYVFKMSSTGLKYGATPCANFYSEGTYTYEDGAGNKIVVTNTNCNTRSATYNGVGI